MKHNMNRMNLIVLECYHEVCRRREAYEGKFVHIFFHLYGLLRAQEMLLNVFRATPLGSPMGLVLLLSTYWRVLGGSV